MIHVHARRKRASRRKEGLLLHGGKERKAWKVVLEVSTSRKRERDFEVD
jgi:hypothetical protein